MPAREEERPVHDEPPEGQFQEAYENADPEVAAVGSIKHDDDDEEEPAVEEEPPTS